MAAEIAPESDVYIWGTLEGITAGLFVLFVWSAIVKPFFGRMLPSRRPRHAKPE